MIDSSVRILTLRRVWAKHMMEPFDTQGLYSVLDIGPAVSSFCMGHRFLFFQIHGDNHFLLLYNVGNMPKSTSFSKEGIYCDAL